MTMTFGKLRVDAQIFEELKKIHHGGLNLRITPLSLLTSEKIIK